MNWRFVALIALSSSPWVYLAVATGADLWARLEGFGFLPFAALLFAKELALKGGDGGSGAVHQPISGSRIAVAAIVAVLLVVGLIAAGGWLRHAAGAHRPWVIAGFASFAGASILWDVRRSHRSIRRGAREPRL